MQARSSFNDHVLQNKFEAGVEGLGSFPSMSKQKPIMFSEKGGKILQKMATNYGKKHKQQQQRYIITSILIIAE